MCFKLCNCLIRMEWKAVILSDRACQNCGLCQSVANSSFTVVQPKGPNLSEENYIVLKQKCSLYANDTLEVNVPWTYNCWFQLKLVLQWKPTATRVQCQLQLNWHYYNHHFVRTVIKPILTLSLIISHYTFVETKCMCRTLIIQAGWLLKFC